MNPKGVLLQQATTNCDKIQFPTSVGSQEDNLPGRCCTSQDQEPLLQQPH